MPQITIQNISNKTIRFTDPSKTMLQIFQENKQDWMHACGGNGRCTTCKMEVVEGGDYLSDYSRPEEKLLESGRLKKGERLACQTKLSQAPATGALTICVPEENKLPHITYTN